jgi:hypothetical protein
MTRKLFHDPQHLHDRAEETTLKLYVAVVFAVFVFVGAILLCAF